MSRMKDTETRKGELLEAAGELFQQKGYRDTSVNSIVESVGVSKGTFYYYFDSKEDVVDALVEKISEPVYEKIDEIIADKTLTAIEKLNEIFAISMQMELDNNEIVRNIFYMIYKPENLRLRDKIQKESVEKTAPKMTKVVKQGVEDGTLDNPFPEEVSRLILWMGIELEEEMADELLDREAEPDVKNILAGFRAYVNSIERILGAPEGSIELIEEEELKELLSFLNRKETLDSGDDKSSDKPKQLNLEDQQ